MKTSLLVFSLCFSALAQAQGIDAIFGGIAAGGKVCYQKTYSGALPAQQRVRSLSAVLGRTAAPVATPYLALTVSLKDRPGMKYGQYMSCLELDERVYCAVDCDGGGMTILAGGSALRLRNEGITLASCGDDIDENGNYVEERERIWLHNDAGGDDRFKLQAAPLASCSDVETYDF